MSLVYVAIALLIVFTMLWLALKPKQGSKASNAPDDDATYQLPKPQEPSPAEAPPRPASKLPKVEYELPETEEEPELADDSDLNDQLRSLLQNNQKIDAIKLVRSKTGLGLKEAKDYVETFPNLEPLPTRDQSAVPYTGQPVGDAEFEEQLWSLLQNHKKIDAIKLVRAKTGWSLKQAKDYLDNTFPAVKPAPIPYNSSIAGDRPAAMGAFDIDRHDINDRVRMFLQDGRKIDAIKLVKTMTDWPLRDAKDYIDNYPDVAPLTVEESGPVKEQLNQLLTEKRHMAAIEIVQRRTGMAIPEAKQYLEQNFDCDFPF